MGCDIHLAVEVRRRTRWARALPPDKLEWYDDRNYCAFAMLANVRNGYGFAGVDTGDGFNFISEPRGLPDDLSPEVRALVEGGDEADVWLGDHSHSWLVLSELLAFDWSQTTTRRGVVTLEVFAEREASGATGRPSEWCGGVSGPRVRTLSQGEARARLRRGKIAVAEDESVYVRISWQESYAEAAGRLHSEVIPALSKLGNPEDVRIVFGFDS